MSRYVCKSCGAESPKWASRCIVCGQWNVLEEKKAPPSSTTPTNRPLPVSLDGEEIPLPPSLNSLESSELIRLPTGSEEIDRLLGGGIVTGSLVLCVGKPGIGKSTLALLIGRHLAQDHLVLYVSGEETGGQVQERARRFGSFPETFLASGETNLEALAKIVAVHRPALLVIDSIQTVRASSCQSTPGSVAQIREATDVLVRLAKSTGTAIWVVGQVNKQADAAGPMSLEHMVDAVLTFEGASGSRLRIVRALKNRYGATDNAAFLEMGEGGLSDAADPARYFLVHRPGGTPRGVAVAAAVVGHRPIFLELAALTIPSGVENPRRIAVGTSRSRLDHVATVLHHRAGCKVAGHEIRASVSGTIAIHDPGLDLGMAAAAASALWGVPAPADTVWLGEITLSGEVRPVLELPRILSEAARLGFRRAVIPWQLEPVVPPAGLEVQPVREVREAVEGLRPAPESGGEPLWQSGPVTPLAGAGALPDQEARKAAAPEGSCDPEADSNSGDVAVSSITPP